MARPPRWRSVRVRVTIGATLVFALAFSLAGVLLVNQVRASLEDDVRQESNTTAMYFKTQLEAGAPLQGIGVGNPNPGVAYQFFGTDGEPIGDSRSAPVAGTFSKPLPQQPDGDKLIVFSQALTPRGTVTIAAAGPLENVRQSVDALTRGLFFGTPLLVLAVGLLIWYFVGRALRPVESLCTEVDEITHTTLHRRVAPSGANDEMDRLANTMNDMLERLESAADRQKRFVADASHELKTPLTTIRTTVEVGLRNPDDADWEAIATRVLDADQQMEALVTDLLDLARLDELQALDAAAVVDLEDLVVGCAESWTGPGELDVSGVVAGRVHGDRRSLTRLVRNLIDNTRAHATTRVVVHLHAVDHEVELVVDDDGAGIPLAERRSVFERFARLDEARSSSGTGLGLAIVKAVTERHGGTVSIADAPIGGARFTVRLPAAVRTRDAVVP